MNLGENIRKYRKLKNMSAKSLGDRLECSAQAILQYERNERTPSIGILNKIANELCVPVELLINTTLDSTASIINTPALQSKVYKLIESSLDDDSKTLEALSVNINNFQSSLRFDDRVKDSILDLIKYVDEDIDLNSLDNKLLNSLFQDIYDLIDFKLYKHFKYIDNISK